MGSDEKAIEEMRARKDALFRADPNSPIPHAERARFAGLRYYPVDPAMRFRVPLVRDPARKSVTMQTSDGLVKHYHDVGHFELRVGDEVVKLHAYEDAHGHEHALFVPFRDATSGKETYGAGRYLDPVEEEPGIFLVDLNLAYNPFCAYNDAYSCPFPPFDNWLQVPLRAGERSYKDA